MWTRNPGGGMLEALRSLPRTQEPCSTGPSPRCWAQCGGAPWATGTWFLSWIPLKVIRESQGLVPGESAPWYFQPNPVPTKHASSANQVLSKYPRGEHKGGAEGRPHQHPSPQECTRQTRSFSLRSLFQMSKTRESRGGVRTVAAQSQPSIEWSRVGHGSGCEPLLLLVLLQGPTQPKASVSHSVASPATPLHPELRLHP